MFFFRHPKPVVDPRPVAEQSVQVKAVALPTLTQVTELPEQQPSAQPAPHANTPADDEPPSPDRIGTEPD